MRGLHEWEEDADGLYSPDICAYACDLGEAIKLAIDEFITVHPTVERQEVEVATLVLPDSRERRYVLTLAGEDLNIGTSQCSYDIMPIDVGPFGPGVPAFEVLYRRLLT